MKFGYFTLSDNNYRADELGMHSVWISRRRSRARDSTRSILYFNLDLKPHDRVKDEMARFMAEAAPEF